MYLRWNSTNHIQIVGIADGFQLSSQFHPDFLFLVLQEIHDIQSTQLQDASAFVWYINYGPSKSEQEN